VARLSITFPAALPAASLQSTDDHHPTRRHGAGAASVARDSDHQCLCGAQPAARDVDPALGCVGTPLTSPDGGRPWLSLSPATGTVTSFTQQQVGAAADVSGSTRRRALYCHDHVYCAWDA